MLNQQTWLNFSKAPVLKNYNLLFKLGRMLSETYKTGSKNVKEISLFHNVIVFFHPL